MSDLDRSSTALSTVTTPADLQHAGQFAWERVTRLAAAASTLADIVRKTYTLRFHTPDPAITVYVHTEWAEVRVLRTDQPEVEVRVMLQAPFAWRLATDQDEAGVYIVARRRSLVKTAVGNLAGALIEVVLPYAAHLTARIDEGRLVVENASGLFDVPGTGTVAQTGKSLIAR